MDWQKFILQKDKVYYFKYRECYGIFTRNNRIFDDSIQINIKITFIVCEQSIKYKKNTKTCQKNFFLCVWYCRNTYTHWSNWFHIHVIFPCYFYLIILLDHWTCFKFSRMKPEELSKSLSCSSLWSFDRFQTWFYCT